MRKLYLFITVLIVLVAASSPARGQLLGNRFYHVSVGLQGGATFYQGDLDDDGLEFWKEKGGDILRQRLVRPAIGIQANFHFNPFMYWRLSYNRGGIQAADSLNQNPARRYRNLHFRSTIDEFSLQLVIEPFARNDYFPFRARWAPYVFGGIGLFHFNPQAKADDLWEQRYPRLFPYSGDNWTDLQPLGTEGQNLPGELRDLYNLPEPYSLWQVSVPFGFGLRRRLAYTWDLRVEFGLRMTFTDYLDDVSGNYAPPSILLDDEYYQNNLRTFLFADRSGYANFGDRTPNLEETEERYYVGAFGYDGEYRGNAGNKDWYGFLTIGVTKILRKRRYGTHR